MKVLDLCSGTGSATKFFDDVDCVDIKFGQDITKLHFEYPGYYDFIWASPPCECWCRDSLPKSWKCNLNGNELDFSVVFSCYRVIRYLKPRYWLLENVKGAKKYFDLFMPYYGHCGSRYLWGEFPIMDCGAVYGKWKLPPGDNRSVLRSMIPGLLAKTIYKTLEYNC